MMQFGGGYNYNVFKPRFIEPEEFRIKKHTDGYVKFLWSFGSNGKYYLFGRDDIDVKREAHNFIVFGTPTLHFREIEKLVTSKDIHKRKSQFMMAVNQELKKGGKKQTLERLHRLQNLPMLARLHRLQNLQTLESLHRKISFETGSYQEYKYEPGDIVYCDPPYEGTEEYSTKFNSRDFYDWVKAQPYPVWFSSYQGVSGFRMVFAKQLRSPYGFGSKSINFECLYTNR